ncbi:MAG: hypothetical protein ACOZE5_15800, partial [Verrucomicrobiota bacterium]
VLRDAQRPAGLGSVDAPPAVLPHLAALETRPAPLPGVGAPRQRAGLKNGALLARAVAAQFDVFLTVDKNLPIQQKLAAYAIAVVVLRCPTNDINDLKKLVPALLAKLPDVRKGEAVIVKA